MRDDSTAPARRHRPPQEARSGGLEGGRYPSYSQGTPRGQTVSLHRPTEAPGSQPCTRARPCSGCWRQQGTRGGRGGSETQRKGTWAVKPSLVPAHRGGRSACSPAQAPAARGAAWAGRGLGGNRGVVWAGSGSGWAGPWEALACERVGCSHSVVPEHLRKAVAEASRLESRHLPEGRPQVTASRDRVEK